jgi:hypothetical protein
MTYPAHAREIKTMHEQGFDEFLGKPLYAQTAFQISYHGF